MVVGRLVSFHHWALERSEGKKGAAADEREEGERVAVVGRGAHTGSKFLQVLKSKMYCSLDSLPC
jgi:hypothetical protein